MPTFSSCFRRGTITYLAPQEKPQSLSLDLRLFHRRFSSNLEEDMDLSSNVAHNQYLKYLVKRYSTSKKGTAQATMTEQSSPLYLLDLLNKLKMENNMGNNDVVEKLMLALELHHLPTPFVHGKKCSNCNHRMHCQSLRCPRCHKDMRKRKRVEKSAEEERKKKCEEEKEREVSGACALDLSGCDTLPCGHKFCTDICKYI